MDSWKNRFSWKNWIELSMISERSSEWSADFKTANQIFVAYENSNFKNLSFLCLFNKYIYKKKFMNFEYIIKMNTNN
jgi:hypothetical protein